MGYDAESGKEIWTVRGLSRLANMTPVIGPDNVLRDWTLVAESGVPTATLNCPMRARPAKSR